MILSLVAGAVTILNASAFLLLPVDQDLLSFIAISAIYGPITWVYAWIVPSALGYRPAMVSEMRTLQYLVAAAGSLLILLVYPGIMGLLFVGMMVADLLIHAPWMLLFRSETKLFLRSELARGVANSAAVLAALMVPGVGVKGYVTLLLINLLVSGFALGVTGRHRPPPLRPAPLRLIRGQLNSVWKSRQLKFLLSARSVEMLVLMALSRGGHLSAAISMKIGMAVSQVLAVNARDKALKLLLPIHLLVYAAGTCVAVVVSHYGTFPVPHALREIQLWNALLVLPAVLLAFTLTALGLRLGDDAVDGEER